MANQKQNKTQKQPNKRRNTDPPERFAFRHPAEKQSKKRKGQGPTKTTTNKDLPWTQWYKATVSQLKIMHQTNWLLSSTGGRYMTYLTFNVVKKRRAQICNQNQIQRFIKIPTELRRQTRTSTTHTKQAQRV